MDDDEGFVSNEYRYERCVCLPEQLLRMRPPKNTDPGLSDSDLDDSDTRSGSDYFVSQQGNALKESPNLVLIKKRQKNNIVYFL